MISKPSALPRDVRSLRRMVIEKETLLAEREVQLAERDRVIAVRDAELYAKTLQIENLKAQLAVLRRARFGRSSEKLDRQIEQLELALGELEESKAQSAAGQEAAMAHQQDETTPVVPRPQKGVPVRKPLPEHLPRERVEHPTACVCPSCGGTRLPCIGTDEREVLEYVPSHFKVVVH